MSLCLSLFFLGLIWRCRWSLSRCNIILHVLKLWGIHNTFKLDPRTKGSFRIILDHIIYWFPTLSKLLYKRLASLQGVLQRITFREDTSSKCSLSHRNLWFYNLLKFVAESAFFCDRLTVKGVSFWFSFAPAFCKWWLVGILKLWWSSYMIVNFREEDDLVWFLSEQWTTLTSSILKMIDW